MPILAVMISNSRTGLLWDASSLAAPGTIELRSADFGDNGFIPLTHAAVRAGGENLSPALAWTAAASVAQFLLVIEDPDAPSRIPYLHCLALLDASLRSLEQGALSAPRVGSGVQFVRSAEGVGYLGPAPPKSHGPHRYVFELFALEAPLDLGANADALSPDALTGLVVSNAKVLARGRIDGLYKRS